MHASPPGQASKSADWPGMLLALIEHAPWPMAVVEGGNHIVSQVNPAFSRLMDRPAAQILGKPGVEVVPAPVFTLLERVYRSGRTESHTEPVGVGARATFWSSTMWPLMADACTMGVIIQVTNAPRWHEQMVAINEKLLLGALHQLEEAASARAEAVAANRAKDHFLAALSHELRTPLTPVLMAAHMLLRSRDLPPRFAEALAMIERNVQFETQLIDDLLDFSSIGCGKLLIACERTNLHEVVRKAIEVVAFDIEGKSQRLTVGLEAPEDTVSSDGKRLQQVFTNLLKNASKFTPARGEIRVRSRMAEASPGGSARIVVEVSDTGIGFPVEAKGRLFEAFSQASEAITREFGGLGLGLAISKAIVDAHGGVLRAHSPGVSKGATFTVDLPLLPADNTMR